MTYSFRFIKTSFREPGIQLRGSSLHPTLFYDSKIVINRQQQIFPMKVLTIQLIDPWSTLGGPTQWVVICMSNLDSFGGQSSHGEHSPLSTLIYFFLLSANQNGFS